MPDEPMLSVILDEFAPFAYPGFTQVSRPRAAPSLVPVLLPEHSAVAAREPSVCGRGFVAPGTKMIMNVSEEHTAQWFLKASSRIATKRAQPVGAQDRIFSTKYTETGTGSESDIKETRAREDHIKNLPVGQMEILMVDTGRAPATPICTCGVFRGSRSRDLNLLSIRRCTAISTRTSA